MRDFSIDACSPRGETQVPHVLIPSSCPAKAVSRQFIKVGPSNGLARKQIAPAFSARVRTLSSGKAVMKINGMPCPWARSRVSSSTPFMMGIWTSAITHDVSFKWLDCRKSSADANVCARYPCDLTRLFVAIRTDASSSIIEITAGLGKVASTSQATESPRRGVAALEGALPSRIRISYIGLGALPLLATDPQRFGHSHQIGQRPRLHFSHRMPAMDLHRDFAHAQFAGDLLVHEALRYERHHFPLARGQ